MKAFMQPWAKNERVIRRKDELPSETQQKHESLQPTTFLLEPYSFPSFLPLPIPHPPPILASASPPTLRAIYGLNPSGFHTIYGQKPSGFSTIYRLNPSGFHTIYRLNPSGFQTIYRLKPNGFHTIYGQKPSGFPACVPRCWWESKKVYFQVVMRCHRERVSRAVPSRAVCPVLSRPVPVSSLFTEAGGSCWASGHGPASTSLPRLMYLVLFLKTRNYVIRYDVMHACPLLGQALGDKHEHWLKMRFGVDLPPVVYVLGMFFF